MVTISIIAACAIAAYCAFLLDGGQFSERQFRRIEKGMTKKEVVAILKLPPGDYTQGKGDYRELDKQGRVLDAVSPLGRRRDCDLGWWGPDGAVEVYFDENAKVGAMWYYHPWPPRPTLFQRVTRWISDRLQ